MTLSGARAATSMQMSVRMQSCGQSGGNIMWTASVKQVSSKFQDKGYF